MRYLRWVGFLSSLLVVAVLMPPVPSEAATTLKLKLVNVSGSDLTWPGVTDVVPEIPITLTVGTCTPTETNTVCYYITRDYYCPAAVPPTTIQGSACLSGNQFQKDNAWRIGDYSADITPSNATDDDQHARVIATDNSGAALDLLKLSWVTFSQAVPNGQRRLVVKWSNDFTVRANTGAYLIGKTMGGSYKLFGGSGGVGGDAIMGFSGTGLFVQGDVTPDAIGTALTSSAGATNAATLYGIGVNGTASLTQSPLSSFATCTYPSGTCRPTINMQLDFKTNNDYVGGAGSWGYEATVCDEPTDVGCKQATKKLQSSLEATARAEAAALKLACDELLGASDIEGCKPTIH